jgi:hypothetical protein
MLKVYLDQTATWKGQDKVATEAVFFMMTHMYAWLPAVAKGVNVQAEFAAIGGTPSMESDKKLAHRIAHAFLRSAKDFYTVKQKAPGTYQDVRNRTRTRLWAALREEDGPKEKFDPGAFEYAADE